MRAPDHVGARRQQPSHNLRRARRRRMGREPVRVAEARPLARDVKEILDRKRGAGERPLPRAGEGRVIVAAERTERVIREGPAGGVIVCNRHCLE